MVLPPEAKNIYLFKPHPSPVREESLCGFCLLCLQFGDWVFVFSVSLVLFSTLFPGGAAEIDSFGSADPPGLWLPKTVLSWKGLDRGRFFPEFLDYVQGSR